MWPKVAVDQTLDQEGGSSIATYSVQWQARAAPT